MFYFKDFLKKGLIDAIGHLPDYWVIMNATGWYEKNVLTLEDLAEINAKIDEKNAPKIENESVEVEDE